MTTELPIKSGRLPFAAEETIASITASRERFVRRHRKGVLALPHRRKLELAFPSHRLERNTLRASRPRSSGPYPPAIRATLEPKTSRARVAVTKIVRK